MGIFRVGEPETPTTALRYGVDLRVTRNDSGFRSRASFVSCSGRAGSFADISQLQVSPCEQQLQTPEWPAAAHMAQECLTPVL